MKYIFLLILFVFLASPIFSQQRIQERIGVSIPLSGDLAFYGSAVQNGFQLAKNDHQELFKDKTFIFEDNKYNSVQSISSVKKLIEIDNVQSLYLWGEVPLLSTATYLKNSSVNVFSMSLAPKPAKNSKNIVISINPPTSWQEKMAERIKEKNWKNIVIVENEDPFIQSMSEAIIELLVDNNIKITRIAIPIDTLELRSFALKVKTLNAGAIGLYLLPGQVGTFAKLLRSTGVSANFFAVDTIDSATEIKLSGGALKNVEFPRLVIPRWFQDKFLLISNGDKSGMVYGWNAYTTAMVIGGGEKVVEAYFTKLNIESINFFVFKTELAKYEGY